MNVQGSSTDVAAVRKFNIEFNDILHFGMNMAGELHLVDILKKLHFLPSTEDLNNKAIERQLYDLLVNSKDNLTIRSELEDDIDNGQQELEGDLTRNLFTIACAINGLSVKQRGRSSIDDRLLSQYLVQITYSSEE